MAENLDVIVARLDERFINMQRSVEQMAEDQRRMAESYEELVRSNQRIGLLESDMISNKASLEKLWRKYEADERARSQTAKTIAMEVFKYAMAIVVALVLAKLGLHIP